MTASSAEAEAAVRAACAVGDIDRATTLALRAYGGEIYGLLAALHRAEGEADDAFAVFSEKLWRSLGRFAWDCSLRSWVYLLARHASRDVRRGERRRRRREEPLGPGSAIEAVAAAVR
ncbi:MAG: sigma-70 family RNA polymerase sigma factor, partial [Polyangiaceae bacterium]|nr:sigma-70 family RNA polymerase sigma factor [Polyangiaceae bacterium]